MADTTNTMVPTPTVTTAPTLPGVEVLRNRGRQELIDLCVARLGAAPPKSWSRVKMAELLHGQCPNKGSYAKKVLTAQYTAKVGMEPAKTWTAAKIAENMASGKLPGGTASKQSAIAAYVEKTGTQPVKSWTTAQLVANTTTGKLPGTKASKGGVTVVMLKQWLKDHNVAKRSTAKRKEDMIALLTANFVCTTTGVKLETVALKAA